VFTRYDDIAEAYRDTELFSVDTLFLPNHPRAFKWIPGEINPPEHTEYRRALMPLVATERMHGIESQAREVAAELMAQVEGDAGCEFIESFARPFPTLLFVRQMGLPAADAAQFKAWTDDYMNAGDPGRQKAAVEAVDDYLWHLVQARKGTSGGTDWLDTIVNGAYAGRPFTDDEMFRIASFLFVAGLATVTALLGVCFHHLAQQPEVRSELRAGEIPANAIEELLRVCGQTAPCHEVKRDVDFAGVQLRQGDVVMLPTQAANHDWRRFPNPERIDFSRSNARQHLTFGLGVHRCLGERIARLELRIALEEWHRAIPDYSINSGDGLRWLGGHNNQLESLSLSW